MPGSTFAQAPNRRIPDPLLQTFARQRSDCPVLENGVIAAEGPPIRVPLPEGALGIPYPHEQVLHFEAGLHLDRLLRPMARVRGHRSCNRVEIAEAAREVRIQAFGSRTLRGLRRKSPRNPGAMQSFW
jgi:hypothetical protein